MASHLSRPNQAAGAAPVSTESDIQREQSTYPTRIVPSDGLETGFSCARGKWAAWHSRCERPGPAAATPGRAVEALLGKEARTESGTSSASRQSRPQYRGRRIDPASISRAVATAEPGAQGIAP